MRGIVGVALEVTRIDAKRKLSQNKSADDVAGVIAGLAGSLALGAEAARRAMQQSADSGSAG